MVKAACAALLTVQIATAHERAYVAILSGADESPPNPSAGIGSVVVEVNLDLFSMRIEADFSNLAGTVTAAHIHGNTSTPLAGMADVITVLPSFTGFPTEVTAGGYDQTFDLTSPSTYNPAFIEASGGTISLASNALLFGLEGGTTYFNIHTTAFSGGEIRGFLLPTPKADFNHDGIVDAGDFAVWAESLGVEHEGDANDDEVTDGSDFLVWQQQFGSIAGFQGPLSAAAVPESGSAMLWAPALLGLAARKRFWKSEEHSLRERKNRLQLQSASEKISGDRVAVFCSGRMLLRF
jgi:hypothetical protein